MRKFAHACIFSMVLLLLSACGSSQPELHIYSWGDYFNPALLERFEKEYDCKIVIDTFDSNEAMYAKLKAGAKGYDLLLPSSYILDLMYQQGMLQPIDRSLIPNIKYIDKKYIKVSKEKEALLDYSVPYMITWTGIAYRKDRVSDIQHNWAVFAREDLRGRMTMLNDIREALGAALIHLGYSVNTRDAGELKQATDLLISWKKNLAKFESEQYKNGIASAEYLVVQGYNGDIMQVMRENPQVGFVLPEEGLILLYDHMVIPHDAKQVKLANEFINFMQDPAVAAENMAFTYFLCPNTGAYPLLNAELKDNPMLFPPQSIIDKSEAIENLGPAVQEYNKAWDAVKAA